MIDIEQIVIELLKEQLPGYGLRYSFYSNPVLFIGHKTLAFDVQLIINNDNLQCRFHTAPCRYLPLADPGLILKIKEVISHCCALHWGLAVLKCRTCPMLGSKYET